MSFIFLASIPLLLSALSGWRNARDVGAFKAALPMPIFFLLLAAAIGLYLVVKNDWAGMTSAFGLLFVMVGIVMAVACLLIGWTAGRIHLRRDEPA